MFDLRPLFRPSFWFESDPTPLLSSNARALLLFFTLLLVGGFVMRLVAKKRFPDRDVREGILKLTRMLVNMGVLGLLWLFFAVEQITFFQGRYWMLIWIIGAVIWGGMVWRYLYRSLPKTRLERLAYEERNKYLPKKKKR